MLRWRNIPWACCWCVDDFGKTASLPPSYNVVKGQWVDIVENHKYLGTPFYKKLNLNIKAVTMFNRGLQSLHFLWWLFVFDVDLKLMTLFYWSFIEWVLNFLPESWNGNLYANKQTATTTRRLDNIVNYYHGFMRKKICQCLFEVTAY